MIRRENKSIGYNNNYQRRTDFCTVCDGRGFIPLFDNDQCSFCNGTGEYTRAAASYMKAHACQCFISAEDKKNCGLCGQKCHHATDNKPVIALAPRM